MSFMVELTVAILASSVAAVAARVANMKYKDKQTTITDEELKRRAKIWEIRYYKSFIILTTASLLLGFCLAIPVLEPMLVGPKPDPPVAADSLEPVKPFGIYLFHEGNDTKARKSTFVLKRLLTLQGLTNFDSSSPRGKSRKDLALTNKELEGIDIMVKYDALLTAEEKPARILQAYLSKTLSRDAIRVGIKPIIDSETPSMLTIFVKRGTIIDDTF